MKCFRVGVLLGGFLSLLNLSHAQLPEVRDTPDLNIQQRIFRIKGMEIRGSTPAGEFSSMVDLILDSKGELVQLQVTAESENAFRDLRQAGIHIMESLQVKDLRQGLSMIEVKDLKYDGRKIPIAGVLLKAELLRFSSKKGGTLRLTYTVNMITGSTASVNLFIRSKLVAVGDSEPAIYNRYWYVTDSEGQAIEAINVVANEWNVPFIGVAPVGVSSLELNHRVQIDDSIQDFYGKVAEIVAREKMFERVENLQRTIHYLKMSKAYFVKVLSQLPSNHPSRADFIEGQRKNDEMLARLQAELKNRSLPER